MIGGLEERIWCSHGGGLRQEPAEALVAARLQSQGREAQGGREVCAVVAMEFEFLGASQDMSHGAVGSVHVSVPVPRRVHGDVLLESRHSEPEFGGWVAQQCAG